MVIFPKCHFGGPRGVQIQGGPDPGGPDPGGPKWGRFWGHFEGPKQLKISSIRGVQHVVAHV